MLFSGQYEKRNTKKYNLLNSSLLMQLLKGHTSPLVRVFSVWTNYQLFISTHAKFLTRSHQNGIRKFDFLPDEQCRIFSDTLYWLSLRTNVIKKCCLLELKQDFFISGYVEFCSIFFELLMLLHIITNIIISFIIIIITITFYLFTIDKNVLHSFRQR